MGCGCQGVGVGMAGKRKKASLEWRGDRLLLAWQRSKGVGVTAKPQSNGTGNCQPVGSELVVGKAQSKNAKLTV